MLEERPLIDGGFGALYGSEISQVFWHLSPPQRDYDGAGATEPGHEHEMGKVCKGSEPHPVRRLG